jgi:hypothetical protein
VITSTYANHRHISYGKGLKRKIKMKLKFLKAVFVSLIMVTSNFSNAGLIDSSSVLLNDSGANQLETWLGQGDLDWDSIWYGTNGATSASWHAAVGRINNTVSIYKAINALGQEVLIGGFTTSNWGGGGYKSDSNAFIFNLTQNEKQDSTGDPSTAIYRSPHHFATFGGGHDLYGGYLYIGNNSLWWKNGYTTSYSYDVTKGSIDVGTDNVRYAADSQMRVIAMETYSFSTAQPVPEPSTLAIFALGMIGLVSRRFKKQT